jgi:hypothetical protein
MSKNIMSWIDILPGVANTNFQKRRDEVAAKMAEAAELVRKAEVLRGQAYLEACSIEGEAKACWAIQIVEAAKRAIEG